MLFSVLSSGSKQNCFYIEESGEAILIDIGLSFNSLIKCLETVGGDYQKVRALFITHEHLDHIAGLKSFMKKTNIPVYIHEKSRLFLDFHCRPARHIDEEMPVQSGVFSVSAFRVNHDAAATFGFKITCRDKSLFLASDIGSYDESITRNAKKSHAIAIESNYDETMLRNSCYPFHIKKRIHGDFGHLSNTEAINFLFKTITEETKNIFFLHLSENNNSIELVSRLVRDRLIPAYPNIRFHISKRMSPIGPIEI